LPALLANDQNLSNVNQVGKDFFTTYRIPILSGRTFNSADPGTSPLVAVFNQANARRFFTGINPIGKTFSDDGPDMRIRESCDIPIEDTCLQPAESARAL
jgi:hypothetical protein